MKEYRVFDPRRRPADVAALLTTGQFVVFLSDVRSGSAADTNGQPRAAGSAATCLVFDSLAEAQTFCRERADHVRNLRCDLHDERCKAAAPLMTFVHPEHATKLPSRAKCRRMILIGLALILPSPIPFLWDLLGHQLALIWPTFIAANLLIIGVRTFLWGYLELHALRAQEQVAARAGAKDGGRR